MGDSLNFVRHPSESWDPVALAYAVARQKPEAMDSSFRWNDGGFVDTFGLGQMN
jgi:hypothetical protein